ncbi:MAG: beta-lactamase family protein [Alphaproteobacteria bacterium]|nr:beta-lactamase family protein [Alphaproteobacteria bacterium]
MESWLEAALDYIPIWLELQMRQYEQPGCIIAILHRGRIVLDRAFGYADLAAREHLTPRHRFRIASHSKSFTAAGVMKLREQKILRLDDPIGAYVKRLNRRIAEVTLAQLLSHSGGVVRDGPDAGQFSGRRPFLAADELLADLQLPPAIEPNTRFKYSNHGYALLGLAIEALTGEPYAKWIRREIVDRAGLAETQPDMPLAKGVPMARGHTSLLPAGRRLAVAGEDHANAIAPAAGFVSTARDTARFFAQLDPAAPDSPLSAASRREMVRRQWRNPHSSVEGYYGLGVIVGALGGWEWFGHSGGLLGYISRTCVIPSHGLSISVLTNAVDGFAHFWLDGTMHILRTFQTRGTPPQRLRNWTGRWWSAWGAGDLIPLGERVVLANPHLFNPFQDAPEIAVTRGDTGRVALAGGYSSHGETVRRERDSRGAVRAVWFGGSMLQREAATVREIERQYGRKPRR